MGIRNQENEVFSEECIISGNLTFLWETDRVCQVDYLTTTDQVNPDWLVKGYISGRGWTVIRLDIRSWFGDVSLSHDSIWDLLLLFFY